MRERNTSVKFPELVGARGKLEELVVDMAHGKFIPSTQLPETLQATTVERYANWISELTQKDPQQSERDGMIHIRKDTNRIIFPSNPAIGTATNVTWVVSKKREKFVPTLDIHSHPTDTCHSAVPPFMSDMRCLLEKTQDDSFAPAGMLVTTPEHNYLMIKSQETSLDVKQNPAIGLDSSEKADGYDSTLLKMDRCAQKGLDYKQYTASIEQLSQEMLNLSFTTHHSNFMDALTFAKKYHLGFYQSKKDGFYTRMSYEITNNHLAKQVDTFLEKMTKTKQ